MGILPDPIISQEEKVKLLAKQLNVCVDRTILNAKQNTEEMFNRFWRSPSCTPMEMSEAYGTSAVDLFYKLEVWQIALMQIDPTYEPFVVPSGYTYVINEDGTVTITPTPSGVFL